MAFASLNFDLNVAENLSKRHVQNNNVWLRIADLFRVATLRRYNSCDAAMRLSGHLDSTILRKWSGNEEPDLPGGSCFLGTSKWDPSNVYSVAVEHATTLT